MDCTLIETAEQLVACSGEIIAPVLSAVIAVGSVAVAVALGFTGWRLAQRVTKEIGNN